MLIGLTGQIGAGKSTAANILASFGAHVIDADKIGRQVVDLSPAVLHSLAREFGQEIITKTGRLSRARLSRQAFADSKSKMRLDRIVHPHLLRELRKEVFSASKLHANIIIDAALLLNWGMDKQVNFVLVIHAPMEIRVRRLMKRGMKRDDIIARQNTQLPLKEYRRRATAVITNDGTQAELKKKLKRLWAQFVK